MIQKRCGHCVERLGVRLRWEVLLTHFPMSLLTGFIMKEDRKPLTYITNGIVAMNFCWREEEKQSEETLNVAMKQNMIDPHELIIHV